MMINNYYGAPFTMRHGQHMLIAVRLDLASWIVGEDPPVPDPEPDPPVPEPEPPTPIPDPEPCPPVPDAPVDPPPEPDEWPIDRHVYPGFVTLIVAESAAAIESQKGRGYQVVDAATLDNWALDPDYWEAHLDKTLAHYGSWRTPHYIFCVGEGEPFFDDLKKYVLRRNGAVIYP